MMATFRKKPVVIEAFRFRVDEIPVWFQQEWSAGRIIAGETFCLIPTLEGVMRGEAGDYIIQGVKGEIYPCKVDIFETTYEQVEEP